MWFDRERFPLIEDAVAKLAAGYSNLPADDSAPDWDAIKDVLGRTAERLHDNFPYGHPLYAGQMLKPPHPVAQLAYWLATFINPNNHALDGGRASSTMEKEVVAELAGMFGFGEQHLGHLTSGGTMANLEALYVAGQEREGVILASEQAHYTHSRISGVLRLPFESVPVDRFARMDMDALEQRLKQGGVSTIVATLGTTAAGAVDPLVDIIRLAREHGVRVHVDSAYGGYFMLAEGLSEKAVMAYGMIREADSVVIDPHKHGLQPYGCGCILFRDPKVGRHYAHDSPYTYFSSDELHLGEISLECSRAGAAAVALWATHQLLPPERGGEFANDLDRCLTAAHQLHGDLAQSEHWQTFMPPELDIILFAEKGGDSASVSARSQAIFEAAAKQDLHIAVARFPRALIEPWWPQLEWNSDSITLLRSCLMKPEHLHWLPEIRNRLEESLN